MGLRRYIKNQFRHDRNTKKSLNDIQLELAKLSDLLKANEIKSQIDWLRTQAMSSSESGISDERYCDEEIIVSLTTFGERINEVFLAIESIMQGTMKPNKLILWLSKNEFKNKPLPITLQKQQRRGLQIEFCEDIRSYKKIVPSMERYPDACIVTIDDDLMYEYDLLENLVNTHISFPDDICACRMHRINVEDNGHPKSYLKWDLEICPSDVSNRLFLTSGGGTLFPAYCFTAEFFDEGRFLDLCPYADDVWINAMALLSGRKIRKVYTHSNNGNDYIPIRLVQDNALCSENMNPNGCRNDIQINAVFDYYDLYHFLAE